MASLHSAGSDALEFRFLYVPDKVVPGSDVRIQCEYKTAVDGPGLYNLKWFKDDVEFYRYTPNERVTEHRRAFFPLDGITPDVSYVSPPPHMSRGTVSRPEHQAFDSFETQR